MQAALFAREINPDTVLHALLLRRGPANGASAKALASEVVGTIADAADERALRQVIEKLRNDGHPVCATPEQGYFLADTPEDINRTCTFLLKRVMSTVRQVAAMRRVAVPDLAGQLGLQLEDQHHEDMKGNSCNTTIASTTSSTGTDSP